MATIVKSFEDYNIGEDMKKMLKAENIEYLGMQVFKKDSSNILRWFDQINNKGSKSFANYIEDRDDEQDIIDGKLKKAVELEELSDVPEINIKPKVAKVGNMTKLALRASFSKDFLQDDKNLITFKETMEKLASSILFVIKERAFYKMIQHAAAPKVPIEEQWIEGNDKIDEDLYHIIDNFEDPTRGAYSLTNLITSKRAMNAVQRYYRTVNGSFNKDNMFPDDNVKRSIQYITQLEKGLIGIDVTKNPCKLFYNVDPDYNTFNKTELKSFLNVIVDDSRMKGALPHLVTVDMFVEFGFGITRPQAIVYEPKV